MTASTSIHLSDVSHSFESDAEKIHLFGGLNQRFEKGDIVSIVGASGTGKSSLLALMAGLESPSGGSIAFSVDGREQSTQNFRKHTGFIFQHFHLIPEMDALNNLALPLRLKGVAEAFETAERWLALIGLVDRAHHKPSQLSGGEQQRIAIARAFISEPDFIFADEPTGNLDLKTAASITDLMLNCAQDTGCGLIVVTHSEGLAERASTRLRLSGGHLEQIQ